MDINKRVQDIDTVFNRNYNVNKNNTERKEFLDNRKEHFKKVYGVKNREDYKKEILKSNSVNGQVTNLNNRMNAFVKGQQSINRNNFKNNFKNNFR